MSRQRLLLCIFLSFGISMSLAGGNHGDWCACGMHSSVPILFQIDHSQEVWQGTAQTALRRWDAYANVFSWTGTDGRAGRNDTNEIVFFDAQSTQDVYGISIDSNTFGVTWIDPDSAFGDFNACPAPPGTSCGSFGETDVVINADFGRGWTSGSPNYDDTGPAVYVATAIHELGHTLGLHHNFDSLTTMNYYEDYAAVYLTLSDSRAARGYYSDQARTTTDIATYPFRFDGTQYSGTTVASASPTNVAPGDTISIRNFTIENIGSVNPSDVRVRLYLSSNTTISTADHELGSVAFSTLSTWWDTTGRDFTVPTTIPGGQYYVGAIAFYNTSTEDGIGYNNSWVLDASRRVTVQDVCSDDGFEGGGPGGDDSCPGATINVDTVQTRSHCDPDWIRFRAFAGVTYEIETSNLQGGADTTIELHDSCGPSLLFDDDGGVGLASRIVWTAPANTFADVVVRQYSDSYRAGERYEIIVRCIANCAGGDPHEPNDHFATAVPIACPEHQTVGTVVLPLGDLDFFSISGPAGTTVSIDIDADELDSSLDPLLGTFDSSGTALATSDDTAAPGEPGSLDSYLEVTMPSDGNLYAAITAYPDFGFSGAGNSVGEYWMTVSCCATPGEVFVGWLSRQTIAWTAMPGSARYDVLRSADVTDFAATAICVATDGADTTAFDAETPMTGQLFVYLVRAEYDCPTGVGSLGYGNGGIERVGPDCGAR